MVQADICIIREKKDLMIMAQEDKTIASSKNQGQGSGTGIQE
jgi:hypothetical protein